MSTNLRLPWIISKINYGQVQVEQDYNLQSHLNNKIYWRLSVQQHHSLALKQDIQKQIFDWFDVTRELLESNPGTYNSWKMI